LNPSITEIVGSNPEIFSIDVLCIYGTFDGPISRIGSPTKIKVFVVLEVILVRKEPEGQIREMYMQLQYPASHV